MNTIKFLLLLVVFAAMASTLQAFDPDPKDEGQLAAAKAIIEIKKADPGIQKFFDDAAGYAVFPKVGKAGIGVGGARGKGLVIQGEKVIADATLTQLTVGFQLGGQVFQE